MRTLLDMSLAACCAAALFLGAGTGAAPAAPTGDPASAAAPAPQEPGVWQEHRYSFVFMGFTSTYSCDGLADKLKLLLLAAGARADATVRSGACASGFGRPDRFARADLVFHTLKPDATPASTTDQAAVGMWRPVALSSHHPRDLRRGDCELVEQFKTGVLPMFSTRDVQGNTTCIPHQASGSNIDLRFEAFIAVHQFAAAHKRGK